MRTYAATPSISNSSRERGAKRRKAGSGSRRTTRPSFDQSASRTSGFGPSRRLRVLLGDPPIGSRDLDRAALDLWILQRDTHFAYVVQREVIARKRRALVIAGVGHVLRRPAPHPTLANLLEGRVVCSPDPVAVTAGISWCDDLARFPPLSVHVVVPDIAFPNRPELERRLEGQPRPSIGSIEGTWLADLTLAGGWTLGDAADEFLLLPRHGG
jgi:hypothetical protein